MVDSSSTNKQRIALVIQYVGTNFHGWQRQPHYRSVQAEIEDAIASIVGHKVTIYGAGRTDSGVHASAQVAHFEVCSPIPAQKWAKVLNSCLPDGILIRASSEVAPIGTPVLPLLIVVIVILYILVKFPTYFYNPLLGITIISR